MNGEAVSVDLHLGHFAKVLRSSPLTNPQRVLCGVAMGPDDEAQETHITGGHHGNVNDGSTGGRYVHVMFMYASHVVGEPNDNSMQLFYKLPLRDS